MELTKSTQPSRRLDPCDLALLSAFALAAVLGAWQRCLLVNDGAIYLAAAWLGNAWDLFFDQNTGRAVSTLMQFGLAWALRPLFGDSSDAFMTAAHLFYFAGPLVLWLILRRLEPQRLYSRLYLVIVLMTIYFTSEMVAGMGLWLIWFAWIAEATRPRPAHIAITLAFAVVVAFTHPAMMLLSLLVAAAGGALILFGRPFPRHQAIAAAAMGVLLVVGYLALAAAFKPSNPTVALQQGLNRYDYVNPVWMLATLGLFPMLAAVWLLLLAPGLESARLRWRLAPPVIVVVGMLGLWFAAAGTGLLTWLYARHTAAHVLAIALALALVAPPVWLASARRPLLWCAAIAAAAYVSYAADLFLFGRFVDRHLKDGVADVTTPSFGWPARLGAEYGERSYLKWAAGADYQRDVVVPMYDWYEVTLAFYSYFRSDRRAVLFHPLQRRGAWIPFECPAVEAAQRRPHDARDTAFLAFLAERYCVRR
jgi:hypothetical protein